MYCIQLSAALTAKEGMRVKAKLLLRWYPDTVARSTTFLRRTFQPESPFSPLLLTEQVECVFPKLRWHLPHCRHSATLTQHHFNSASFPAQNMTCCPSLKALWKSSMCFTAQWLNLWRWMEKRWVITQQYNAMVLLAILFSKNGAHFRKGPLLSGSTACSTMISNHQRT